jgi:hypothetical protein
MASDSFGEIPVKTGEHSGHFCSLSTLQVEAIFPGCQCAYAEMIFPDTMIAIAAIG